MPQRNVPLQALEQITAACREEGRRQLTEWEVYRVLRHWQVPVAPCYLVADPPQAAKVARLLRDSVAVKIVSPDIPHKTESGCVKLGLAVPAEAAGACAEVLANASFHHPGARIDGVLVQQMVPPGVEVIAGGVNDPAFGPVLMAGMGGIFAEVMHDVAFRLAPVSVVQVTELLRSLKGYPLLTGVRGRPPVDLRLLTQALANLSRLLEAWTDLAELDLNPLIAGPDGVVVVDGLATLKG